MSTHQQIEESAKALADEIKQRHEACQWIQEGAIQSIHDTIKARVEVARLVEAAHATIGSGVRFAKWWRDADMPVGWAAKYLTLAKTADRHALGDKGQLRLIGLLPEAEHGNQGQHREPSAFAWTGWAGKIRRTLTPEAIKGMGQTDREVAAKQLEPLVEVYNELKGGRL